MSGLKELYQEIIIDHGKTPRNIGALTKASHVHVGHNPLCGDKLTLYVQTKNNEIEDIKFEGSGCAISMAAASLMTEAVKGKSLKNIDTLFDAFHQLVTTGEAEEEILGKLAVFAGVFEYPARVKCASLAWHTLKAALMNEVHTSSTE